MTELEKSKTEPKKQEGQTVDPFARLRAQLKGFKAGSMATKTVYLVLDSSGSMSAYCNTRSGQNISKRDAVRNVVQDVLSTYSSRVNLAQIKFSDLAEPIVSLNDYYGGGGTNIQAGLQLLQINGAHAVLLSDGGETQGSARTDIPRLVDAGIVVNTIGVGVDPGGEALLREIAEKTGGAYAGIDADVSAIFETFKRLVSKAVAALTAGKQAIEGGA